MTTVHRPIRGEELGGEEALQWLEALDQALADTVANFTQGTGDMRNADNLALLNDFVAARANLDVPSFAETDTAIANALGGGMGGSGLLFTFTQDTPSALWTIAHNLNAFLNVTVVDSLIRQVEADVQFVDLNTITVGFAVPATGQAFLS